MYILLFVLELKRITHFFDIENLFRFLKKKKEKNINKIRFLSLSWATHFLVRSPKSSPFNFTHNLHLNFH